MIRLVYFAWVRERIGIDEEEIALPPGVTTVGGLLDWLAGRSARHAAAVVDHSAVRVAVDQVMATADTPVAAGSEVAIFPPVTGG